MSKPFQFKTLLMFGLTISFKPGPDPRIRFLPVFPKDQNNFFMFNTFAVTSFQMESNAWFNALIFNSAVSKNADDQSPPSWPELSTSFNTSTYNESGTDTQDSSNVGGKRTTQ